MILLYSICIIISFICSVIATKIINNDYEFDDMDLFIIILCSLFWPIFLIFLLLRYSFGLLLNLINYNWSKIKFKKNKRIIKKTKLEEVEVEFNESI
jgi:hypothetical protein